MLEILQYVTSSLPVFLGCVIFTCSVIGTTGWAINAMLLGWRGVKCDQPE